MGPTTPAVAGSTLHVLVESWSADLRMGATNDPLDLAEYGQQVRLRVTLCGPATPDYLKRVGDVGAQWRDYTSVAFGRRNIVGFGLGVLRGVQLLRQVRPDVVHINYAGWGPSLARAARLMGIPVVARPGAFDAGNPLNRWVDGYVALTEAQAAHVLAAPSARPVEFVGPFISMSRLLAAQTSHAPLPPRLGRGCRFLYLGQLVPRKGIGVLLEAFAASGSDGELLLVGGDWAADAHGRELTASIDRLQLAGRVRTCDHRTDVGPLLRECDVFVLPSLGEAIPRSVLEAMVLGRPVIATRVGGIPTVVTDGVTGVLVEPGDVDGLATALQRLGSDATLRSRIGAAASAWAAEAVNPVETARRYREAYERLIDAARRPRPHA